MEFIINFALIKNSLPALIEGLSYSLYISFFACFIGFWGGLLLAIIQKKNIPILKIFIQIYLLVIRGTPMIIQLLILYFFLPTIGIEISQLTCAIIAIGMNSIAYMSQVILIGIRSINKGEILAATSLGFNNYQVYRYIIIPQAFYRILPSLINECITLVKDSSLAHIIGVSEIIYQANIIISQTYDVISIYFIVGILYFISTSILTIILYFYERKITCI